MFLSLVQEAGFLVLEFGTYLIKPFSNVQMEKLISQNIVSTSVVAGLDGMIKYMPELGCEMFVNMKVNDRSKYDP
jgi:hypothetical protein